MKICLLILLVLIINSAVSFVYTVSDPSLSTPSWALLSVNFLFYLGITQTGIVFSAIMRIAKSEWGKRFSRLGEVLTLSFLPLAFIIFIIIYLGGTDHLFYWADPETNGHDVHISPWLSKGLFFWRYIITSAIFYALSYTYFRVGRMEEKGVRVSYDLEKRLNVLAAFVMIAYAATNTNVAWEFGMMIIRHWESTIFPPYYWVGNVFAGTAFLFIISNFFIPRVNGKPLDKNHQDSLGKLLIGFTLLWTYMFWSQHIVLWYGDIPNLVEPFRKKMSGSFTPVFTAMIFALFVIPFFSLCFRKIKLSLPALFIVAVIITIGVWIDRYLMIIPVFEDNNRMLITWINAGLFTGGASLTLLSVIAFKKLFRNISLTTENDSRD